MCLYEMLYGENPKASGVGYKVFGITKSGAMHGVWYPCPMDDGTLFVEKVRYESIPAQVGVFSSPVKTYVAGFHIFESKEQADAYLNTPACSQVGPRFWYNAYCVKQVKWEHQLARGIEFVGGPRPTPIEDCPFVIVAKYMTIVPEPFMKRVRKYIAHLWKSE